MRLCQPIDQLNARNSVGAILLLACLVLVGVAACSDSSGAGCATDDDCKADRACVENECTYLDDVPGGVADDNSSVAGDESTNAGDSDEGGQTGNAADGPTSCSSASECASDETCVGSGDASDAGTCETYWACDGWGEGHDSTGRCVKSWECSNTSYALVCPKTGTSGARCECQVDGEVVREFVHDGDGCAVPDVDDFASFECGWAVSPPPS